MRTSDPVVAYLLKRGCPQWVVDRGLEGLVASWEATVESVVAHRVQYQDDYLNDMDCREIIEGALAVLPPHDRQVWVDRVGKADVAIRKVLVRTEECLWGSENEHMHGYTRERNWWYYHRPPKTESAWRTF